MNFGHSQKGVTAVSMIIIIVILILIATFSLFSSRDLVVESSMAKAYNELSMMRNALRSLSLQDSYEDTTILSTLKVTNIGEYNSRVGGKMTTEKTYYYFGYKDPDVEKSVKQELNDLLDLRSVANSYIVCINEPGNVEVMLVDGIKYGDTKYYTYDEIANVYANVTEK
ncbi:MAG: hypothetical protein IJ215_01835 [Clostridia bacterium]|nr:hypothetical protein [Clostridia bacterium]